MADSALPIGSLAHSFGLETLVAENYVAPSDLLTYLESLLQESLLLDAVFCRAAHTRAVDGLPVADLNDQLSAFRLARESRDASLSLGRRFSALLADLENTPEIEPSHFSVAFGFAAGTLGIDADECVAAFLHQNVMSAVSAAQRLMPIGQRAANRILWRLKPAILRAVGDSRILPDDAVCFSHLSEVASMRHPNLFTRLFIS